MPLQNKSPVVVVTGSSGLIGRGLSAYFVDHGYTVVGWDIAQPGRLSPPVDFFQTDVAEEREVKDAAGRVLAAYGRIDALINNAGIAHPHSGKLEALAVEDWNRVLAVNLTGAMLCVKHTAAALKLSRGAVVNIASTRAVQSEPESEAYAASKGGLVALTHALAVSLGPEVRVNCISPGWIADPEPHVSPVDHAQHPAGRIGTPADIAALAYFLTGSESGFITGHHYLVDGGMTRKMQYQ